MAGIDKTYITSYEVYDKVRNWAKDQIIKLKNGKEIKLINLIYYPDITLEEWKEREANYKKEHPDWQFDVILWNTPTYVDVWLIKNCPFEEIQDRLKEQYGGGWSKQAFTEHNDEDMYEQIKNGTSIYDTYQRNGLGKKAKVVFKTIYGSWIRDKKLWWWITIKEPRGFWYNKHTNSWHQHEELIPITSNVCTFKGTLTKKNIINLIKKWDLPKGTVLRFEALYNRYSMHEFNVIVK